LDSLEQAMSRRCDITHKGGQNGHKVSHANNKANIVREVNLTKRRIWVAELKKFVTVRLSAHGLKILDRKGAFAALKDSGVI
jgi:large subunit ribosomal protein L28